MPERPDVAQAATARPVLTPRPVFGSVGEMLAGCTRREPFVPDDARSGARFERVDLDGERLVVKHVHLDDDFTMRVTGDLGCRPLRVWQAGLMDLASAYVDHAVLACAARDGRNGWGAAMLMRDVSAELVPVGDDPVTDEQHLRLLDHMAGFAATAWGWRDDLGLLPPHYRWWMFSRVALQGERRLGMPEAVPRLAEEGWQRFGARAPRDVRDLVAALETDPWPLAQAVADTPTTFLHGDWKLGNLGTADDGRTVLLDWAYPGEGPVASELTWYLALNRARLPAGHDKESTITAFEAALGRHGVDTSGWWERQLGLCLLGALVQFGWEKALGPDDELSWWCDRARDGARWL